LGVGDTDGVGDAFKVTFIDQLTWSGLIGFSLALLISKSLHEMGHALTATHYGVRVGHMGVAMVVLFPMLYTDTSESWKLQNPRQRLAIASAGILTELALAGVATLAWSLAPEGSLKSALFFLATTGWILTLGINASPFMRFDGYFILTDLLDLPNLHERSTMLARIWLRRQLLGMNEAWPERLPGHGNALMILFALLTWLYRLILFVGIALLVYHFFFKLLGIVLFVVELAVFVAKPVMSELKVWYARRGEVSKARKYAWGLSLLVLGVIVLLPWQTGVRGEGWLHSARQLNVYSPLAGRLVSLPQEGKVLEGQTLFVLESPDFTISANRASGLAQARAKELLGLTGLPDGEERRARVQLEREKFLAEANSYKREQSRMQLIAPFGGVLLDLDALLSPGVWVQPRQNLAVLVDPAQWVVDVFVAESDVARIRAGDSARVQVNSAIPYYLDGKVMEVDASRATTLPHPMLDAKSGGAIATLTTAGNENMPRDTLFRVRIALNEAPVSVKAITCKAVISAEGRSLLISFLERTIAIVIRESGF
jgi:putative peptide zinc metalloprotease protein